MPFLITRANVDFGAARPRDLNYDMTGRAKAVNPQTRAFPICLLDAGQTQRAIADDPCTQQGRRLQIIKAIGQFVCERCRRDRVLGIAAVNRPARELRALAEILATGSAEVALTASLVKPGDSHSLTGFQVGNVR